MHRRIIGGLIVLLPLVVALSCKQESATSTDTSSTASSTAASSTAGSAGRAGLTGATGPTGTFQVTLSFSGAAHLDPDVKPPFIVIPNFTNPPPPHPPHKPFIVAAVDAVAPNGLPNSEDQFDDDAIDPVTHQPKPKLLGHFMWGDIPSTGVTIDLAASDVTFPSPTVNMDLDDESKDACPNTSDLNSHTKDTSLHWLPRLWRISKASASSSVSVKSNFAATDPDPADVAARLVLNGGTLQTQLTPTQRKYTFQIGGHQAPDDITQAVAMSLDYIFLVDLPLNNPQFVLRGREFKTGRLIDLGIFKPRPGTKEIEINIVNMPFHDFFHVHDTKSIPHFALHYKVIDGAPHEAEPVFTKTQCVDGGLKPLYECGPTG
jgi:hypothetical protein